MCGVYMCVVCVFHSMLFCSRDALTVEERAAVEEAEKNPSLLTVVNVSNVALRGSPLPPPPPHQRNSGMNTAYAMTINYSTTDLGLISMQ